MTILPNWYESICIFTIHTPQKYEIRVTGHGSRVTKQTEQEGFRPQPFCFANRSSRGLEPKFASQISIGALPLWRPLRLRSGSCHPDDVEKFFFHTFLGFESLAKGAYLTEQEGFEPPVPFGTTVFKTVALNRSATAPD